MLKSTDYHQLIFLSTKKLLIYRKLYNLLLSILTVSIVFFGLHCGGEIISIFRYTRQKFIAAIIQHIPDKSFQIVH